MDSRVKVEIYNGMPVKGPPQNCPGIYYSSFSGNLWQARLIGVLWKIGWDWMGAIERIAC